MCLVSLPGRNVDATDGALMSIIIGVGVTLVFFLGLSGLQDCVAAGNGDAVGFRSWFEVSMVCVEKLH